MPEGIERATIEDVDKLYQIEKECFPKEAFIKEHIAFLLADRDCICLVYKVKGEIVAFIMGEITLNEKVTRGHILTLDVFPVYRRKGIGVKLLEAVEEKMQERGVEICYLEVRKDNVAALNLYHKMGYDKRETLENYYGNSDGILLKKSLS